MAKIFKKFNKKTQNPRKEARQQAPKVKEDIMDPILYSGGLDKEKYPQLPLEILLRPII